MRGILTHFSKQRPDVLDPAGDMPAVMPDGTEAYWVGMVIPRDDWNAEVGGFVFDPIALTITKEEPND